jgi:uncharacterized protein (DUF433 family)
MPEMPSNKYVEIRNQAYYLAGTRIGLDLLVHAFREGRSAEDFFKAYPSLQSLTQVYGAILFMLENPDAVEEYMREQDRRWKELYEMYPMPEEMLDELERDDEELERKSA